MPVIELEPHEISTILKALAELPHKESAALIKKIVHEDARQKMKAPPEKAVLHQRRNKQ